MIKNKTLFLNIFTCILQILFAWTILAFFPFSSTHCIWLLLLLLIKPLENKHWYSNICSSCKVCMNIHQILDMTWLFKHCEIKYGVIHLWRPQKMTNLLSPPPYPHHPQKWIIDLLFKNNRIRKHETNLKIPPSPFRVDVIYVWPLLQKTPLVS